MRALATTSHRLTREELLGLLSSCEARAAPRATRSEDACPVFADLGLRLDQDRLKVLLAARRLRTRMRSSARLRRRDLRQILRIWRQLKSLDRAEIQLLEAEYFQDLGGEG